MTRDDVINEQKRVDIEKNDVINELNGKGGDVIRAKWHFRDHSSVKNEPLLTTNNVIIRQNQIWILR